MTILITGGAGYIGSHMVWTLLDAGESVVVVDNLVTGFDWAVAQDATLVTGNIGDAALLDTVMGKHQVEAVIHFAGSAVVPESMTDPLKYYANNTSNTCTLIEACVRNGVRNFIFSSTAAVYGAVGRAPVPEDAPVEPLSPYGRSKVMSETMLADAAAAHDFACVALRYFNVAGADPRGRTGQSTANATHLIKAACQAALGKRAGLSVFGTDYDTPDGTGVRDYIHVADLVDAHARALGWLREREADKTSLRETRTASVLNCGYGTGFSVREVIASVKRVSGRDFAVRDEPRRPGDSPMVVALAQKVRHDLDWQPRFDDLDTIVAHALAWEESLGRRNRA